MARSRERGDQIMWGGVSAAALSLEQPGPLPHWAVYTAHLDSWRPGGQVLLLRLFSHSAGAQSIGAHFAQPLDVGQAVVQATAGGLITAWMDANS